MSAPAPDPDVSPAAWEHLQRLMGSWDMLADLSFSDLLLLLPVPGEPVTFSVVGQVRPTTSQTLHRDDLVGRTMAASDRPVVARSWRQVEILEGQLNVRGRGERARIHCVPVTFRGEPLAVMSRESFFGVGRRPGELERVYLELFERFATMVFEGTYPFAHDEATVAESPRVVDGVVALDHNRRVVYASPNALNALHRLNVGLAGDHRSLEDMGLDDGVTQRVWESGLPVIDEVERDPDVAVLVRCIPYVSRGEVGGALVLLRDVTDLRRRDRLLLSKDASIREIHHRVKNSLQTVSSLLRLQRRRLGSEEGRAALREAELRVQAIAVVHEILSREVGELVPFDEIVQALARMTEQSTGGRRRVRVSVEGHAGELEGDIAAPLSVAINELLQNAVRHAFSPSGSEQAHGRVVLAFSSESSPGGSVLVVRVQDDGVGLPPGFRVEESSGLGLSIVRDLVSSQLNGTMELSAKSGTRVELRLPVPA